MSAAVSPSAADLDAAYANALVRWHIANRAERLHANRCWRSMTGQRCETCLQRQADQSVAAERVYELRMAGTRH